MEYKPQVISKGPHHLAVFKPHNLAVVGGRGVPRPTLLDLMREVFGKNIFPVHRIDRVTSGIVIFARSTFAKHAMENAFQKRLVKKIYHAVCQGAPKFKKITVEEKLKKVFLKPQSAGAPAKQVVDPQGEKACTHVRLIKQIDVNFCLIEAKPVSGRMHQIRAHLAHLNLPILGDKLYGSTIFCGPHTIALCSVFLSMPLPRGGRVDINATSFFHPNNYLPSNSK